MKAYAWFVNPNTKGEVGPMCKQCAERLPIGTFADKASLKDDENFCIGCGKWIRPFDLRNDHITVASVVLDL